MSGLENKALLNSISACEVFEQTERILAHRSFAHSPVFQRFLRFVVRESLEGRTNKLKEYTIAREVLDKPERFNAQEDCIVRVHAMRLRKALDSYYDELAGNCGQIMISIPKGQYAPVFSRIGESNLETQVLACNQGVNHPVDHTGTPSFFITPFHYSGKNPTLVEFAEGLGIELGCALGGADWCSVLSSSLIRDRSMDEARNECTYMIYGELRCQGNRVRVSVEMARNADLRQVWGEVFEYPWSPDSSFKIQDELVTVLMDKFAQVTRKVVRSGSSAKVVPLT